MAPQFLRQANAIRPEDAAGAGEHDEALALQDLYYDCYMSSFSREDLIRRLNRVLEGDFDLPQEKEVDEQIYRRAYTREARRVLSSL